MTRAIGILVLEYGLSPDTVEAFPVSRLLKYIKLAADLNKEREKLRGSQ